MAGNPMISMFTFTELFYFAGVDLVILLICAVSVLFLLILETFIMKLFSHYGVLSGNLPCPPPVVQGRAPAGTYDYERELD